MNYFREKMSSLIVLALCAGIFVISFVLYQLPLKAVIYPMGVSALILGGFFVYKALKFKKEREKLNRIVEELNELPHSDSANKNEVMLSILAELGSNSKVLIKCYREIIDALVNIITTQANEYFAAQEDTRDYYTTWVHQIKVPIASMKLNLQNDDSEKSRVLMAELTNIEKYVEMVLCYMRLNSEKNDYVFGRTEVLSIVRPEIRKLSAQFIGKGLGIKIGTENLTVITDEKWLAFAISQILSNAVKYTKQGGITVSCNENSLVISDTGIGIDPGDLPLVFKKGYTGINGRTDKTASGLGLYLTGKILANLGHKIRIESEPNVGTSVIITFADSQIV